jgi:uncharacterized membrane protein
LCDLKPSPVSLSLHFLSLSAPFTLLQPHWPLCCHPNTCTSGFLRVLVSAWNSFLQHHLADSFISFHVLLKHFLSLVIRHQAWHLSLPSLSHWHSTDQLLTLSTCLWFVPLYQTVSLQSWLTKNTLPGGAEIKITEKLFLPQRSPHVSESYQLTSN